MIRLTGLIVLSLTITFIGNAQNFQVMFGEPGEELANMGIDTTNLEQVRTLVDTTYTRLRIPAIKFLALRGHADLIPKIRAYHYESLNRRFGPALTNYLEALYLLNDPNIISLLHEYVDTLNARRKRGAPYIPSNIVHALRLLLNKNDYSRFALADSVFGDPRKPTALELDLLVGFATKPEYRVAAYNRIKSYSTVSGLFDRWDFLEAIKQFNDFPETLEIIRDIAVSDPDYSVQHMALRILLFEYNDPYFYTACEQIASQASDSSRVVSPVNLLEFASTPQSYIALKNIQAARPQDWSVALFIDAIEYFKPRRPNVGIRVLTMLDSLISTTSQVASFNWLSNVGFTSELDVDLQSARSLLVAGDSVNCAGKVKSFQSKIDGEYKDSLDGDSRTVTVEGWKFLYYNAQYILDRLPAPPSTIAYSLFATHSMHLEQNSDVYSGDIGVNAAGSPPFLDEQLELSIGIGTSTPAGYAVRANRIKVKSGSVVNGNVYYNELDNNGTITGSQNTPLQLPLVTTLPEFKSATPGTEDVNVPQNGSQTLQPGNYNNVDVNQNGTITLTGGTYHFNSWNTGDDVQVIFQAPTEIRIADKIDSGQGSYIGPQDTTTMTADQIIFYVGGINGSNGNLGATPKAAKIGIGNTVWASFYAPNGTLWIRQNSQAKGQFIGKDVDVGIGVKIRR